jgi:hypothetical protein
VTDRFRSAGFALRLVALAAAFGGVAYGGTRLVERDRQLQEYTAARSGIEAELKSVLFNREVLKMAARFPPSAEAGNVALSACLLGRGGPCTATDALQPAAFVLASGIQPSAPRLAGTRTTPADYAADGAIGCAEASASPCPGWRARAWFWADCAGGAPSCAKAERLHVGLQVMPVGALAGLAASPPDAALAATPERFARIVEVMP